MSTYLKQQNRWNKSFFRESIISVKKIMNNPFVALWTILEVSMFMMLVYSVVDFFVGNVREFDWLRVLAFLVIIFIVALCRNIHYMLKHPLSFLLSPFYGVLHLFVLQPLKLYSLLLLEMLIGEHVKIIINQLDLGSDKGAKLGVNKVS